MQFSENYTFTISTGGGIRVWIAGVLRIDKWSDNYPTSFNTSPIALTAGQLYDIRIEYFNSDDKTGIGLLWSSASLPLEYVQQSQLYADSVSTPPPPPPSGNQPPAVNAGADRSITLPTNSLSLYATSVTDDKSGTLTYRWSKVSGPSNWVHHGREQLTMQKFSREVS